MSRTAEPPVAAVRAAPTEAEIAEQIRRARVAEAMFRAEQPEAELDSSFMEGVIAALTWMTGDSDLAPMD